MALGSSRHAEAKKRRAPTFEGSPATDFAITTVNVPDRLDLQEVRARAEEDDFPRRRLFSIDSYTFALWFKRLFWLGAIGVIGYFGSEKVLPLKDEFSANGIATRLSQQLGQKVIIGASNFNFSPNPRLVLTDIRIGERLHLPEVALRFNWDEIARALRIGRWAWGEAEISALQLSDNDAKAFLALIPSLTQGMHHTISSVRFVSLQFPDYPLLPGKFQLVLRRTSDSTFGPIVLEQLGGIDQTQMALRLMPGINASGEQNIEFHLDAQRWGAPVGPTVPWQELVADGSISSNLFSISSYTASGYYGVVQGSLVAAKDLSWVVTGTAKASNMDIEAVMRQARAGSKLLELSGTGVEDSWRSPLLGTANASLIITGRGRSLGEALETMVAIGPVEVRSATLNGINLGFAATQGKAISGGNGITRFTALDADLVINQGGILMKDISARAGALATRGDIKIGEDLKLVGGLKVDLGASRVQAPISVQVKGTALAPEFGR